MSTRSVYLGLCVLGILLPYSQFVSWLWEHGLNLPLLYSDMFASRINTFFVFDVLISAVVVLVLVLTEGKRLGVEHLWAPIAGTLVVGVSFGLPLFLYLRERRRMTSA